MLVLLVTILSQSVEALTEGSQLAILNSNFCPCFKITVYFLNFSVTSEVRRSHNGKALSNLVLTLTQVYLHPFVVVAVVPCLVNLPTEGFVQIIQSALTINKIKQELM